LKPLVFHPRARGEIRAMPKPIRFAFGRALYALQIGQTIGMPLSRPMPAVAMGVEELRVADASGQYRTFYLKKSAQGILVLRAFHKKAQQTPLREIDLARRRLKELIGET
jgi:phage-related protein